MNYLPGKEEQKNFDDNWWNGLWVLIITAVMFVGAVSYAIGAIFNVPIVQTLFGGDLTDLQKKRKPAAVAIISSAAGLSFLAVVMYVRFAGGLHGVGVDAPKTGHFFSD